MLNDDGCYFKSVDQKSSSGDAAAAMSQRIDHQARVLFASNVRARRHLLGLSQEVLASRSGLHRTYVGSVERGERNISIDNMQRLADALDVPLVALLAGSPE